MTSLRLKLQKSLQKLLRPSKRRIAGDDQQDKEPEQTKQLRTVASEPAGPGAPPQTSSSGSLSASSSSTLPSPPANQTLGLSSSPTFARMSDYPVFGPSDLLGTATNPIDLTEDGAAPGPAYPAAPASWNGPVLSPPSDEIGFDNAGRRARMEMGQIVNDKVLAQRMGEQLAQVYPSIPPASLADPDKIERGKELAAYGKRLQSARCVKCEASVKIDAASLIQNTIKMLKNTGYLHPCVRCHKCKGWFCVGGDTYHKDNVPVLGYVASGKDFKVTWCCDEGRLALIFYLLCGFEPMPSMTSPPRNKPKLRSVSEPSLGTTSSAHATPGSSRTPGQSLLSKGTGYGPAIPPLPPKLTIPLGKDNGSDMETYFQALSLVLPCMGKNTATIFDYTQQRTVAAMLPRSPMLQHACEVLRYAAIEEIGARHGPITAALDFLEVVTNHFDTTTVVLRERILFPRAEQLLQAVLVSRKEDAAEMPKYETAQSVCVILEQLAVPCRKFVEASKRVQNMDADDEQGSLAVMKRICAIADSLVSCGGATETTVTASQAVSAPSRGLAANSAAGPSTVPNPALVKELSSAWHRANCIKELPDQAILESFSYTKEAIAAEKAKPAPGRMRKLLAQVASLSTALPDGIYVRHGESRPDLLKVLIVGPAGTPYENGLFEFDMFCGRNFPKSPPKMQFKTTGGGVVSFNPNLYVTGKICLSLLGTWEGHPWEPDRSTILQVLVSIQSMILNDKPFFNEPGYETRTDNGRAQSYNRFLEPLTVQHAMLYWLNDRLANPNKKQIVTPPAPSTDPPPPNLNALFQNASIPPPDFSTGPWALAAAAAPPHLLHPLPPMPVPTVVSGGNRDTDDPVWGEVIRKHFELRSSTIMATVREWEQKARRLPTEPAMASLVPVLEERLKELGFRK